MQIRFYFPLLINTKRPMACAETPGVTLTIAKHQQPLHQASSCSGIQVWVHELCPVAAAHIWCSFMLLCRGARGLLLLAMHAYRVARVILFGVKSSMMQNNFVWRGATSFSPLENT